MRVQPPGGPPAGPAASPFGAAPVAPAPAPFGTMGGPVSAPAPAPTVAPSIQTFSPTARGEPAPSRAPSAGPAPSAMPSTAMPSAYRFVPNRANPSVTRITEVCVDLKLSTSESIGPDGMLVRPKVSLGGFFTEIIGSKLNLGYKNIKDRKHEKAMPDENIAIKLKIERAKLKFAKNSYLINPVSYTHLTLPTNREV